MEIEPTFFHKLVPAEGVLLLHGADLLVDFFHRRNSSRCFLQIIFIKLVAEVEKSKTLKM